MFSYLSREQQMALGFIPDIIWFLRVYNFHGIMYRYVFLYMQNTKLRHLNRLPPPGLPQEFDSQGIWGSGEFVALNRLYCGESEAKLTNSTK